jgi:hypothetical protein
MRKHNAIDLMKLKAHGSHVGWNEALTKYYNDLDINGLAKLRYSIQAGMDDLVKAKLNTEEMNLWFLRLNRSIELTAKRIIKIKIPLPQDQPLIAKDLEFVSVATQKKKRDDELMAFLLRSAY